MQNEILILIGVPGSGKSTYTNKLLKQDKSYVKVSRDDFRKMFRDDWNPGEEIEALVTSACDAAVKSALKKGFNVVLDNTHCTSKVLKDTIRNYGKDARIVLKFFDVDLATAKRQNLQRDKIVPEGVIDKMYKGFNGIVKNKKEYLELINSALVGSTTLEPVKQDESLPRAIIVDIDGTVAHMNGKRGPFEWHNVDRDDPDKHVLNIIKTLSVDYEIIFVSGRDESCRQLTEEWLSVYFGDKGEYYYDLYMRPANNFEKDNIIKSRIFNEKIKDEFYVEAIFDDRDQVVEMWRGLGLKCLQVEYGNF